MLKLFRTNTWWNAVVPQVLGWMYMCMREETTQDVSFTKELALFFFVALISISVFGYLYDLDQSTLLSFSIPDRYCQLALFVFDSCPDRIELERSDQPRIDLFFGRNRTDQRTCFPGNQSSFTSPTGQLNPARKISTRSDSYTSNFQQESFLPSFYPTEHIFFLLE